MIQDLVIERVTKTIDERNEMLEIETLRTLQLNLIGYLIRAKLIEKYESVVFWQEAIDEVERIIKKKESEQL